MGDIEKFKELEKEDRILFGDRKVPLEVEEKDENRFHIKGPQGGEYILFKAEEQEKLLVAPKGRRSYASYIEDLRKVGKWERDGGKWKHSKTGKIVELAKNEIGRWTVDTTLETGFEPPKYGYSNEESALEEAEKLVEDHPEGK